MAELFGWDQKRKQTRKRQSHDDKHHLLEGPFHVKSGPGYISHQAYTCCGEDSSPLQQKSVWGVPESSSCSSCLHTYSHFETVGRSRFLILAPLSNPGIKSRIREKIPGGWRTTFHDIHSERFKLDFKTCMAQGLSNGCAGLLVFLCVSSACVTNQKKRRPLDFSPPKRGDEWRGSLANARAQANCHSHCEGADFRRRRRHRCLRFCVLQING